MDKASELRKPSEQDLVFSLLWRLKQPDLRWETLEASETHEGAEYDVVRHTTTLDNFEVTVQKRKVQDPQKVKSDSETHSIVVREKKGVSMGPFKADPKKRDPIRDLFLNINERQVKSKIQAVPTTPTETAK